LTLMDMPSSKINKCFSFFFCRKNKIKSIPHPLNTILHTYLCKEKTTEEGFHPSTSSTSFTNSVPLTLMDMLSSKINEFPNPTAISSIDFLAPF
jgi:hypothetical protein